MDKMATEELDIFTSLTTILFVITAPHTYSNVKICFISEGLFVNNTKYSKQKYFFSLMLLLHSLCIEWKYLQRSFKELNVYKVYSIDWHIHSWKKVRFLLQPCILNISLNKVLKIQSRSSQYFVNSALIQLS